MLLSSKHALHSKASWLEFKVFVLVGMVSDGLGLPAYSHSVNTSELGLKHPKYFAAKLRDVPSPFYWPCGNVTIPDNNKRG